MCRRAETQVDEEQEIYVIIDKLVFVILLSMHVRTPTLSGTVLHTSASSNRLRHPPAHSHTLWHTLAHFYTLWHTPTHFRTLQNALAHFRTLWHAPTHFHTLWHAPARAHMCCLLMGEWKTPFNFWLLCLLTNYAVRSSFLFWLWCQGIRVCIMLGGF